MRFLETKQDLSTSSRSAIFFVFLLLLINNSWAALTKPIQLTDHDYQSDLAPYVSYIEDVDGTYALEHVKKLKDWQKITGSAFNQGYSTSTYWLKFSIEDGFLADQPVQLYLHVAYPMLDQLEIFELSNLRPLITKKIGADQPFSARIVQHRDFLYPFQLARQEEKTFYVKVRSNGALQVPLNIWDAKTFIENENDIKYGFGFYYGSMLVMVFYNLFLFLSIRHISYIFYIGYICSFAAIQLATSGIGYQYLWPNFPEFAQISSQVTVALTSFFGLQFTRYFLATKKHHWKIDIALRAVVILSAALLVMTPFLPIPILSIWSMAVAMLFLILILFSASFMLIKGHRQARFFLAGWVFFLIGSAITVLMMMGLLPVNSFTLHASKYGSILEVILLSLALADRINLLERDKRHIQHETKLQLEDKNRELAQSNKLKDQFLATISHELRTPMNGVVGVMELLNHSKPSEYEKDKLSMGLASAQEMMLLVNNILSLSELEARSLKLKNEDYSLQQLASYIKHNWHKAAERKGLSFSVNFAEERNGIQIDASCLKQITDHLASNAIKFTGKGHVTIDINLIKANNLSANLMLKISDTGPGINESTLSFLMQPFTQADGSFQRKHGGIGIGLAICKRILNLMNGTIDYKKNPEGGSIFTVKIPVKVTDKAPAPIEVNKEAIVEQEQTLNRPHRILVVEDNIVNQKVACAILKKLGYEYIATNNGQEALELLAEDSEIDLILMDCQMPIMDGFTASRAIRNLEPPKCNIPIIAVTANAMSIDRERCLNSGMNDYLSKPIHLDELRVIMLNWFIKGADAACEPKPAN